MSISAKGWESCFKQCLCGDVHRDSLRLFCLGCGHHSEGSRNETRLIGFHALHTNFGDISQEIPVFFVLSVSRMYINAIGFQTFCFQCPLYVYGWRGSISPPYEHDAMSGNPGEEQG